MEKRKVRVLLADDEMHIRMLLKHIITRLGGEVVGEAANGEEAVALYDTLRPEMTLLDINMPKLNGDAALKRIMALNPRALVLMLTSQNTLETVQECLESGASNYILKGMPGEELYETIKEAWKDYVEDIRRGNTA